jgi:hypothetical protein
MEPDFSRLRKIRREIWEAEIELETCLSALHLYRDMGMQYITQIREKRDTAERLRGWIHKFREQEREILNHWGGYMDTVPLFY